MLTEAAPGFKRRCQYCSGRAVNTAAVGLSILQWKGVTAAAVGLSILQWKGVNTAAVGLSVLQR